MCRARAQPAGTRWRLSWPASGGRTPNPRGLGQRLAWRVLTAPDVRRCGGLLDALAPAGWTSSGRARTPVREAPMSVRWLRHCGPTGAACATTRRPGSPAPAAPADSPALRAPCCSTPPATRPDQSSTSSSPSPTDRHTSDRVPAAATAGTRSRRGIRARRPHDLAAAFAGQIRALGRPACGRAHRLACRPGRTELTLWGRSEAPPQRARRGTSAAGVSPPQRRAEPGTLHAHRPITAAMPPDSALKEVSIWRILGMQRRSSKGAQKGDCVPAWGAATARM
jgi:hypothetical protein